MDPTFIAGGQVVAGSNPVSPTREVAMPTSRTRRTSNSPIAASRSPAVRFSARAAATIRSITCSRATHYRGRTADLPRHAELIDFRLINQPGPYGLWVHGHLPPLVRPPSGKGGHRAVVHRSGRCVENVGSIEGGVRQQACELGGTLVATLMK